MGKLKRKNYEDLLEPMTAELDGVARWAAATGARIAIVFEGRDAAGKGGVIAAIMQDLNSRQARIVALAKPSEREATQWYFQRYIAHLPAAGEIVLFDRSWYNRAGVESVMGYAKPEQVETFLDQTPVFERMLVDDGILLFKYWLSCDQAEQEARFAERLDDPLKRWKLSPIDVAAREKYNAYTDARKAMLKATHRPHTPWTIVDFNDQRRGRLTLIRDFLDRLPDTHVDPPQIALDPLGHEPSHERFGKLEPITAFKT